MLPVIIWVVLRVITSVIAGMVSSIIPLTSLEASVPFFPPSAPISLWLERAFVSPWMRWDAIWYERIVSQGYSATNGTTQFHPLFAWLATPLARIGISPSLSILIISSVSGIALFYFFFKFAKNNSSPQDAIFATLLFTLAPPAFIIFAPYSEGLFLLWAVLCLISARNKSWWMAGIFGGLATLTRQQGLFLLIPIAWLMWENANKDYRILISNYKNIFSLALIPFGYLVWVIYRAIVLNDVKLDINHPLEFISSLFVSPGGTKVVPIYGLTWPWLAIKMAAEKLYFHSDIDIWINVLFGIGFLILFAVAWKKLDWANRLYALAITLISFSLYTGPVHPYMGLPRHLLLAFPVFIGAASVLTSSWKRFFMIGISALGWSFLLIMYCLESWVA